MVFPFSCPPPNGPVPVYDGETVEDLQRDGMRIIQNRTGFRFGEDSVFLAHHAAALVQPGRAVRIADLGTGSGIVAILLASLLPDARLAGLELLPRLAGMAARSVALNGLDGRVRILACDLRSQDLPEAGSFDLAVCNPPYREPGRGIPPADPVRAAATLETTLTPDDTALAARRLLRPHGTLVMTQLPGRLPDVLESLRRHGMEPRTLREILPSEGKSASTILLTAERDAKPGGFVLLPPLAVRSADGRFTDAAEACFSEDGPDMERRADGWVRVPGPAPQT